MNTETRIKNGPIATEMPLMDEMSTEQRPFVVEKTPERFRKRCRICGSRERMEYDHFVPRARGGKGLRLICWRCNRIKSDKMLSDRQLREWSKYRRVQARGTLFAEGWI